MNEEQGKARRQRLLAAHEKRIEAEIATINAAGLTIHHIHSDIKMVLAGKAGSQRCKEGELDGKN